MIMMINNNDKILDATVYLELYWVLYMNYPN